MDSQAPDPAATPTHTERRPLTRRDVLRCTAAKRADSAEPDTIAVEEPLEIRLSGDALATVMRTPGEDRFLVAGFLFSEGIIHELSELGRIAHCGRPTDVGYGNVIDIAPGPGHVLAPELAGMRRGTIVSSSCGVCGRERIDDLLERLPRWTGEALDGSIPAPRIAGSLDQLRALQRTFDSTGAVHGALVCDDRGDALASSEDVGRHNAVDKVVGKLLFAGQLSTQRHDGNLLAVSGRTSFEIVQKAAVARIRCIVSVSAPSSLAIDLAEAVGVTLIGFARAGSFNVYTHAQRVGW